jgi:hypothetical protein
MGRIGKSYHRYPGGVVLPGVESRLLFARMEKRSSRFATLLLALLLIAGLSIAVWA